MKRFALVLALALLGTVAVRAQADDHRGPVVYPPGAAGGLAPDTNTAPIPSSTDSSFASNATPSSSGDPVVLPSDSTPSTPAPQPYPPVAAPAGNGTASPDSTASAPDAPAAASPGANSTLAPLQGLAAATPQAGGKLEDIDDIRPPYFYLKPLTWLWILLGALALLALAAGLWVWFKPIRALRAKTAYELTLEKLEKARALLDEKNPEPYAVLVSEAVRGYLGQRFHTPSTRRTTEEFLRQMQADPGTPLAEHRELLRSFLEACDLVKFAHHQPAREELEQVQQRAVSFVTATRPLEGAPA